MRFVLLGFLLAAPVLAQTVSAPNIVAPRTLALDGSFLAQAKAHPSPEILAAVRSEADEAMSVGPFSVMDKKEVPPSWTSTTT